MPFSLSFYVCSLPWQCGGRTAGEYLNYGERLYVEGVVDRERKQREAQLLKMEEAQQELQVGIHLPLNQH